VRGLLRIAIRTTTVTLLAILAAVFLCFGQADELFTLYSEAREAQSAGDYKTATEKYQRIVTLRPDMAEVHSNLGILYYQQKKSSEASNHFRKAIELKPSLGAPYFFSGNSLFR
jgi:Flp pilus assembly protein TadD